MIQRSPGRVLGTLALLAVVFAVVSYPGRNGTLTGAFRYICGLSWVASQLCVAAIVVLTAYLLVTRARARRSRAEH